MTRILARPVCGGGVMRRSTVLMFGVVLTSGVIMVGRCAFEAEAVYRGRAASEWLAQLGAADPRDRWGAAEAGRHLGGAAGRAALPRLLELLGDDHHLVQANAAVALGRMGPNAVGIVAD